MFSLKRKKEDELPSSQPFTPATTDEVARIAVAENGQIVFASPAFLALSHLSAEQTTAQDFAKIIRFEHHIETPANINPGIHNVHINGHTEALKFQFDWLEAPDSQRYLIGSYSKPEEKPKGIFTQNNAPKISKQKVEKLLNLSHDIALITDQNGKIAHINDSFATKLGYDITDLDNIDFISLFTPEDQATVTQTITARRPENDILKFEAHIQTKSGETRCIEWRQTEDNNALYYTGQDVTDIKAQEKAIKRHEKQLLQAESLGRMGHWRWVLDEDDIEWSAEIYRIFGVDPENFEPTLHSMNTMVHRDDADRVNQALQRAIIEENDYDVEFSILRPDGEERFIRSEGRCSINDDGEVTALFGIMQDMTERMLYERELKNAKDAAERAYAAKTQFLANMSHELRTPLNAIIGFSEMMERQLLGPLGNEKYLDYIGGIRDSGEHLLDLISDILDMSKIEAGKYELMLEEINIAKLTKLAVHMMEGRALEANLKITAAAPIKNDAPDDNIAIIADRRAVLQILLNLLSNAVKFSKENGEISVECFARDDYIALKVIDNGIGIPANKLATITRPFEQVSSSYARDHEGSGLGLAITKELAELHGGTLFLESQLGEGTTVTVRLPYEAVKG